LASGVVFLIARLVVTLDPAHVLLPFAGYIPLMLAFASLDELLLGMLQGTQSFRQMATAQILRSMLRLVLTVTFIGVMALGLMGLVYSWILSFALSATYQYFALPTQKNLAFSRPLLTEALRFGLPLQGSRFLWFVFLQVNPILLGTLAGPTSVAYYSVAARIPDALQRLSESFTAVYFPTVTALIAKGSRLEATRILNYSLRLASFVAAVAALTAIVFGEQIIVTFFSDTYARSAPAFGLLMIALHMTFMVNLMGYTLTSAGHPGRSLGENVAAPHLASWAP
jgi:O-antigen/teichoic acid export membrane protein